MEAWIKVACGWAWGADYNSDGPFEGGLPPYHGLASGQTTGREHSHIVLRFRNITAKRDVPALDRSLVPFVCLEAVLMPPHSPLTPTPASTDGHPSIRFQPPPPHPWHSLPDL